MARQSALYTGGESSSVPVERAEELLESLLFTFRFGEEAGAGAALPPDERLRSCQRALWGRVERAKGLFRLAKMASPLRDNAFFCFSLNELETFFKWYDLRFFAHALPACPNYPLALPPPETPGGICYIGESLRRLVIEMRFVTCFSPAQLRALWSAWQPEYRDLCLNLCEPLFLQALGLALLGAEVRPLSMGPAHREALLALLRELPPGKMESRLLSATERLCNLLELWDAPVRSYLRAIAKNFLPRLPGAIKEDASPPFFVL